MGKIYKRTTDRAKYGEETLKRALVELENGERLATTARRYGVPRRTLRRHRDHQVRSPGQAFLGRFKPDIERVEERLVAYLKEMERAFFGLSTKDVRRLAYDLAAREGLQHRFNCQRKLAGLAWLQGFMKRHPDLSIRKHQATSVNRCIGFNRGDVGRFFKIYKEELDKGGMTAGRIWNADETGISTVQKPQQVLAERGRRRVGRITSGERGSNVTVMCAASAGGQYVPPMFIFPRKRMNDALMNGAPPGSVGASSPSGWMDADTFLEWLQHFADHAKPSPEEPHILILDGHVSHKTLAAITFARDHGIVMVTLPRTAHIACSRLT